MSLPTEHELSAELLKLEQQLQTLVPCSIPQGMMNRIEQSMLATGESSPPAEDDFDDLEIHLGHIAPTAMPEDMLGRMVRAMDRWHEHVPVEEKVVPFGEKQTSTAERQQARKRMFAAAAAVALLGAVTALTLPRFSKDPQISTASVASTHTITHDPGNTVMVDVAPRDALFLPDSLSHKVTKTSDHGVVMTRDNTPHRCIRVDYIDRIKVQDDEGREIEIERPGVDYMLLPVETN